MLDRPEAKDLYNETIVGCDNMKCVVKKKENEKEK